MRYLRGWEAMRQDPQWMGKVGVASLVALSTMCIPIVGQIALIGWHALILRRAVSGQDAPLPRMDFDFDYLTKLLTTGFKGFLASMIWSLPIIMAVFVGYGCFAMGMFGMAGGVAAGAEAGGEAGAGVGMIVGLLLMGLGMLTMFALIMVGQLLLQVAFMRAELTDDVNAALRFKEVFAMAKMLWKELIIGMFVMQFIGMAAAFVGLISLYLLLFPAIMVMQIITTFWRAELYSVYLQKGGEPLPIGPLTVEGGDMPTVGQHPPAGPPARF